MKLLQCKSCGTYRREAYVNAPMSFRAQFTDKGTFLFADPDFDPNGREWEKVVLGLCPECEGELEIVEIEQCPHDWRRVLSGWSDRPRQRCRLCNREREGRVIFDVTV